MEAAQFDRRVLVEKGVNGREIEVSVLGNDDPKASIAGEIRPCDDFYSYDAKYINEGSELLIPAPIDDATMQSVREIAIKATGHRLRGYGSRGFSARPRHQPSLSQ
jgi:D-alanine-D-alanine ligase